MHVISMRRGGGPRRAIAVAWVLCALVALPEEALSQEAPDPAREAFERGSSALQGSRFRDAIESLETSVRLRPLPVALYNLGLAYRGIGRNLDAIATFERYLSSPEPDAPPDRLDALRQEVARLRETLVTLRITLQPSATVLRVDGRPPTSSADAAGVVTVIVDPGPHFLSADAEGFHSTNETVVAGAGERREVAMRLEALPTPPRSVPPRPRLQLRLSPEFAFAFASSGGNGFVPGATLAAALDVRRLGASGHGYMARAALVYSTATEVLSTQASRLGGRLDLGWAWRGTITGSPRVALLWNASAALGLTLGRATFAQTFTATPAPAQTEFAVDVSGIVSIGIDLRLWGFLLGADLGARVSPYGSSDLIHPWLEAGGRVTVGVDFAL